MRGVPMDKVKTAERMFDARVPLVPERTPVIDLPNIHPRGAPNRSSFPASAPPCRIFRPSPSVTQSGGRRKKWVLEFEPASPRWVEPLMGWTASDDAFAQIRLIFPSLAAAVEYAEREGLDYRVIEPPARRFVPKSYRESILGPGYRKPPRWQPGASKLGWRPRPENSRRQA